MNNDVQREVSATSALVVGIFLILMTMAVYWNVLDCDFISFDDPLYILDRIQIPNGLTAENIRWALTTTIDANWIPVTWLSFLLDTSLFGVSSRAYHAVNLAFHLANTLLVLLVLRQMTGCFWRSAAVAAFFAVHPLHVESVAWIAERKDVLSGFFFLLTLLAYDSYIKKQTVLRYFVVLLIFVLGICSKSMLVTTPLVLLLLDYWPLHRLVPEDKQGVPLTRLVLEKVPFICCALASGLITLNIQNFAGAVVGYARSSLVQNIGNALVSYVTYSYKTLIPLDLSIIYPFTSQIPLWQSLGAGGLLMAVSAMVFRWQRERPYLVVGWLWFLGMLLPVIGVVRVGSQAMADRYTYLPHIGLFLMLVWGGGESRFSRNIGGRMLMAATMALLLIFSFLTWKQVGYWHNSMTLFKHAVSVTEDNWMAYEHLGSAYYKQGDLRQALEYTRESIRINPRNLGSYINLGVIYNNLHDNQQAAQAFKEAQQIQVEMQRMLYDKRNK